MDKAQIEALKASVDLAEVLKACGLELERVGKNLRTRCPFHEDREASLTVNPERQLFNCFGCQTGGDALSFLQLKEGLSFPAALERLQKMVGELPVPRIHGQGNGKGNGNGRSTRKKGRRKAAVPEDGLAGGLSRNQVLERVAELYHQRFLESPEAQQYLVSRGLGDRELWEGFRVGFADGSLLKMLPRSGPIREALTQLGVVQQNGREHFKGCLVVPLEHPERGVVGLYGRKLDDDQRVRHLYLPGARQGVLNWQALKVSSRLMVTESVLDAMSLWVAGARDVTCLHGTQNLSCDLAELMERFGTSEVLFCLDNDRAGREAVLRLATRLFGQGIRCLRVQLPDGQDPNQVLVDRGGEGLLELLCEPRPVEGRDSEKTFSPRREDTGEGFRLGFGDVIYQVAPQPPFSGKLKVLANVTRPGHPGRFLDTLNLYSQKMRQWMVRQVSTQLELPRHEIEPQVALLLREAEDWVATFHQVAGAENLELVRQEAPEMSPEEREQTLEQLRDGDLVDHLLADLEAMGYVGEDHGKLLAYLIGLSRKLEKPLSGIVTSQSGAGKSAMTELVEALTPPEEVYTYTRVSPMALAYMPRDYLKHRLLIMEERQGGEAADYTIRTLQSRRRITLATVVKDPVTGQLKTRHFEVEGPIAYLETTTATRLNPENTSRCFEITLDESVEQTLRIQQAQREARSLQGLLRPSRESIRERHHRMQRLLEPVKVVIPYVDHLRFPARWLRTRRDHERFLSLVEVIAFLHQHQRERGVCEESGREYVVANLEDYQLAYTLASAILHSTLHELTPSAREVWMAAREMLRGSDWEGPAHFSRRDLRQFTGLQSHRVRQALDELVEMEYLGVLQGSQGRAYRYRLLVEDEEGGPSPLRDLTTPAELEQLLGAGRAGQLTT